MQALRFRCEQAARRDPGSGGDTVRQHRPTASSHVTAHHPTLTTQPSPLTTHHSPLTTHHSPLTTQPSTLTTHPHHSHSPLTLTTHHSPLTLTTHTHHSPLNPHHSPLTTQPSTLTLTRCGTTAYMSPERIKGESYAYPSDVWSFAIVALEGMQHACCM